MEKNDNQEIRNRLDLFQKERPFSRLLKTIKHWVTGSFHFWFSLKMKERLYEQTLSAHGENSHLVRSKYVEYQEKERSYIFGRKINPFILKTMENLRSAGMNDEEIRLLLVNKLIDKKGNIKISRTKEKILAGIGILFLINFAIGLVLLLALIWTSPLPIAYKIGFEIIVVGIAGYAGYVMSYFSILPFKLVKSIKLDDMYHSE